MAIRTRHMPILFGLTCVAGVAFGQAPIVELAESIQPLVEEAPDGAEIEPPGEVFYSPGPSVPRVVRDQVSSTVRPMHAALDRERLYFCEESDGLWVRGRTYKARASARGFTYVPFFGSDAHRLYPIEMRLASVSQGSDHMELLDQAGATRQENSFRLERGVAVAEYALAPGSVEQSFTIEGPFAAGDLTLRIDVVSDLTMYRRANEITFDTAIGSVRYGAAIAFDARGRRTEVSTTIEDGAIALTVPAEFMGRAVGPVVVDPIIETFVVSDAAVSEPFVAVTYDLTSDHYVYAFQQAFGFLDSDVYVKRVTRLGAVIDEYPVNLSMSSWTLPNIASLNHADAALVVATRGSLSNQTEIVGRVITAGPSGDVLGPELLIGNTTNGGASTWSNTLPDVGGNHSSSALAKFCVVWERQFSSGSTFPRFRTVAADGALGTVRGADAVQGTECRYAAISESTGDPSNVNVWNVVYHRRNVGGSNRHLRALQLNADGMVVTGPETIFEADPTAPLGPPDVSDAVRQMGLEPTYAVTTTTGTTADQDIYVVLARESQALRAVNLSAREHCIRTLEHKAPSVTATATRFIVAYLEVGNAGFAPYVTSLNLIPGDDFSIAERRVALRDTPADAALDIEIASEYSGGLLTGDEMAIGASMRATPLGNLDIEGASYTSDSPSGFGRQYCEGVPNSTGDKGFLGLVGDDSTLSQKTLIASALPPQQFSLLVVGTIEGTVPNLGSGVGTLCMVGNVGRYNDQITQIGLDGRAEFVVLPQLIPLGGAFVPAMSGSTYRWQAWHRDLTQGGAQTSNLTNGVALTFD